MPFVTKINDRNFVLFSHNLLLHVIQLFIMPQLINPIS